MEKLAKISIINGIIVLFIVLLGYFLFRDMPGLFSSILIVAVIMFIVPIAIVRYYETWKIRTLEDFFPQFMHDLVEAIRSGMTLPQAVKSISGNDYGHLTPYVKKLDAQLDWGIPFDEAFLKFSRSTKSKLIGRIATTIIESHRFGGNLTDIFEAISSVSVEIERLREERKLYINSQLITGYIIFFVFLVVIIGLQKFLVPTLTEVTVGEIIVGPKEIESEYNTIFRNLIILQGLIAGIVIGKMSEGAIASGIKHSLFLLITGIVVYTVAGVF
jgi:pilus assembly protein TadC